ncbi:TIGR03619 family F420-dependent LLM class oxidoreductase [Nocardia sp. NPDC050799]|uniref:TIGR03619 family F420-dependent LLM class oxidoreductase n=1 Tax=Nocardia sp. NPDC050799 TaxID=3154842 RepID=UPI003409BF33
MEFTLEHPLGQHGCVPELQGHRGTTAVVTAAEAAGFSAISFTEHPAPPRWWIDRGGHPSMDPLAALSFCAAVSTELRLMTHLLVLPYHRPLALAKTIATVDVLSSGRLILGVGNGYLRAEFDALGIDFDQRERYFHDTLQTLHTVWRHNQPPDASADDIMCEPAPRQLPHPPIWVGGSSRTARLRAAAFGQGWMPLMMPPRLARATRSASLATVAELATAIRELTDFLGERDRDPANFEIQVYAEESAISSPYYSPAAHTDYIGRLTEAGATRFVVRPSPAGTAQCLDSIAAYGETIVAVFS